MHFTLGVALFISACHPTVSPPDAVAPSSADSSAPAPSASVPSPALSAKTDSGTSVKTFFIREVLADCEGEGPMKCMQVRSSERDEWTLFYGAIEGFVYEESYAYELRVSVEPRQKVPMDAPALRYRLIEVVSKRKAASYKSP